MAAPPRARRLARVLLCIFPALGLAYLVAVGWKLTPARPERVWTLAALPLAALVLGARTGARGVIVGALLELALAYPLHQALTLIRAWRLE